MSFWDNVKKFAQPYADDDYDDYDEDDDYLDDDYEEPAAPARRSARRAAAPAPAPVPAPVMADEEDEEEDAYGFSPVAPAATGMTAAAPNGFSGQILGGRNAAGNKQEVVLFRPGSFNDTSKAADDLRSRKAVIVNMENVDKALTRRVVDFLSGSVYALDGSVKKVAQSTYLFCPHNMDVVGDLESLQNEATYI